MYSPRSTSLSLFHISKEHQITTGECSTQPMADCFTFQKSIKSQPRTKDVWRAPTVSHFKRASNHNVWPCRPCPERLFHISKEHQITTGVDLRRDCARLFHISKEHQITTACRRPFGSRNCFTFQKSIKSQHNDEDGRHNLHCFTFQKSIKSQRD